MTIFVSTICIANIGIALDVLGTHSCLTFTGLGAHIPAMNGILNKKE